MLLSKSLIKKTRAIRASIHNEVYVKVIMSKNIFSTGAAAQCGFVFCSPLAGLWPPRVGGFLITHKDAPQSIGLLWTSD
jgi:hypothetical protein